MQTKFKDVAHLYLGCKIKTEEGEGTLNGLYNDGNEPIVSFNLVHAHLNFDEVKPILRPLSDMTELEHHIVNGIKPETNDYTRDAARTTFLLSRGFDLFGLIESGEAISEVNATQEENKQLGQSTVI